MLNYRLDLDWRLARDIYINDEFDRVDVKSNKKSEPYNYALVRTIAYT